MPCLKFIYISNRCRQWETIARKINMPLCFSSYVIPNAGVKFGTEDLFLTKIEINVSRAFADISAIEDYETKR